MEKLKHLLKEYIIPLGTEALVILILFKFVFLLVMVPTGSMLPKIQEGGVIFCTHLHSLKNIERGDILISINGTHITTADQLSSLLYGFEVVQTVTAVVYRGGYQYELQLTIGEDKG